jgi:predicted ATPase/DNA-binding SARP family transcriptional activator
MNRIDPAGSTSPKELRVQLLGGFKVHVGSRAIADSEWRLRKAASLVKMLALATGHRLHKEQLTETLWPDLDPRRASNSFRKALHVARRTLAPASDYLHVNDDLLTLSSTAPLRVDVEEFEAAASAARRSGMPDAYRQAIELYTGDLLPEDRYEEWSLGRREQLRATYFSLVIDLAHLYEERGDLQPAVEALQRIADLDPLYEEAQAALMRLHAQAGRRHLAVWQYNSYRNMLRRELSTEPGPAIEALHAQISAGTFPAQGQSIPTSPPGRPAPRHNLSAHLTSFIGREREMAEVKHLLSRARLLTLTGPGGSGKTRLALELAASLVEGYPDGVWLVELAAISDPALMPQGLAQALDVIEQPGRPLVDTLVEYLRSRSLLLILDNCEHLVGECARVAELLLRACPRVRILSTSREALNIPGEVVWPVPPLTVPDPERLPSLLALAQFEAVRLFCERAAATFPRFELTAENAVAVARICKRLDGTPLAIELAAPRVRALSVAQIAARLERSFSLLTSASRTALPRHQTLSATIEWSYNLLSQQEKVLFRRLSVFAGGFTLEGVEEVCAGGAVSQDQALDLLSLLLDKSLVMVLDVDPGEDVRYRLLETLRQYGHLRLAESGELEETKRRHARYYLELSERAEPQLRGPQQIAWMERLEREHDNLRSALDWSRLHDAEMGLRIAGNLWWFWDVRGYHSEGRRRLTTLLNLAPQRTATRARALNCAGSLAARQGELRPAEPLLYESLEIFREVGDPQGEAGALERVGLMRCLGGDYAGGRESLLESLALFRALGDKTGMSWVLSDLGMSVRIEEDYESAQAFLEEGLRYLRETGDLRGLAHALNSLGQFARLDRDFSRAEALLEESLALSRKLGDKPFTAWALQCLGEVARRKGDLTHARALLLDGLRILRDVGHARHIAQTLCALGVLAVQQGDYARGVRLFNSAVSIHPQVRSSLDTDEKAAWDISVATARTALGDEDYARACAEGASMTLPRALDEAMLEQAAGESVPS